MEKFKIKGEWFFVGCENEKVNGELIYSEDGQIILNLDEDLTHYNYANHDLPVIYGTTNHNKYTLFNNKNEHSVLTGNVNRISSRYILNGLHIESLDFKFIKNIDLHFNSLPIFIKRSGINSSFNKIPTFQYEPLDNIHFTIDENYSCEFITYPLGKNRDNLFQVEEHQKILLKSKDEASLKSVLIIASKFKDFFSFALYGETTILSLSYFDNKNKIIIYIGGISKNIDVKRYYPLFNYYSITNEFNSVIQNWFSSYLKLKPFLELFLLDLYSFDDRLKPHNFTNSINALETFHRRLMDDTETNFNVEEFEKLSAKLKKTLSKEELKMLRTHFEYGNKLSLRNRLRKIIKKNRIDIFANLFDETFIDNVCEIRNYYTHWEAKNYLVPLEKRLDMFGYYWGIRLLLIIVLFKHIGVSNESIVEIIRANKWRFPDKLN